MPTVYVTAPPDAAENLARQLVEDRLAACVNMLDCQSVYRWDDEIHDDEERILLVKTTEDRYEQLKARVVELHPYDVPCIERFEETDLLDSFAEWRETATRESQRSA